MRQEKKSKKNQTTSLLTKLKGIWLLVLFGVSIVYFMFLAIKGEVKEYLINNNSNVVNAVIIDEKNFIGNNKVSNTFSYSYKFIVNRKVYKNNSQNENLRIGDSIRIEYYPNYPKFNRALKHKK